MRVKIVQQASGPGSYPVGTILDLPEDEARGLCQHRDSHAGSFAIPWPEERTETADAPASARTETRAEVKVEAVPKVTPPPVVEEPKAEEPKAAEPVRRGPGRPPGSTNKPRPQ